MLGGRTILHGITNNSLRANCFNNQYRRVHKVTGTWVHDLALIASGTSIAGYAGLLQGGRTVLDGITNNSLRVDTRITGYAGLLLGGHTILSGIAISSPSVDCFENLYRRVCRVTAR